MSKEVFNQKYIKISQSNFLKVTSFHSGDSYFRSLEAYLVKNNRKYNIDEEDCFIYVNDKEDAMSLGFYFNFHKIMYFDGQELLSLALVKKKVKESTRMIISNNSGEEITKKNLKEQPYEEAKKHCLEKKEIIKRGILTKKELEYAIEDNKLNEIKIVKRSYFDRQELADFIKKKKR